VSADEARNRFRRRIATGLYLLLLGSAFVGVRWGAWYRIFVEERQIGETMTGHEYLRWSDVPAVEGEEPLTLQERYTRHMTENTLRPYTLTLMACLLAAFFASYNLASGARIELPVLSSTVALVGIGVFVIHRIHTDQSIFMEVARLTAKPGGGQGPLKIPVLRFGWGLSLFVASSLVMLILSVYLTFLAPRASVEKT